jgi:hypothetical protein
MSSLLPADGEVGPFEVDEIETEDVDSYSEEEFWFSCEEEVAK